MQPLKHTAYLEWLGLEMDGGLEPAAKGRLERHLESCAECRATRLALGRVAAELDAERVAARRGFAEEVLAALPAAAWEARRPSGWVPGAVLSLLLLGVAAVVVMAVQASATGPAAPASPAAIVELAGALLRGQVALAGALWRGLAMAVAQLIAGSTVTLVGLGAAVLAIDILVLRLCVTGRRRRTGGAVGHRDAGPAAS